VFHIAAILGAVQASKRQYLKVNVDATESLLQTAIDRNAEKFMFTSSSGATGPQGSIECPMNESTIEKPKGYYYLSKLKAEKIILEKAPENLPVVIIRPSNIYGPNMNRRSGSIKIFNGLNRQAFPIIGSGNNYVHFTYIDNLINGIITCTEKTITGKEIYFISDSKPYNLMELLNEIRAQLNSTTRIVKIPFSLAYPLAWITEKFSKLVRWGIGFDTELVKGLATNAYIYSIEKARNIGFQPEIGLQEGIKRSIAYLESA
jgi:nucleoside-diphosphate-sugar epimerase